MFCPLEFSLVFSNFLREPALFSVCVCCWPAKTFLSTLSWPVLTFRWRFWASLKLTAWLAPSRRGTTLVRPQKAFAALFSELSAPVLTFGDSAPWRCLPRRASYRCLFTCQCACVLAMLTCVSWQLAEHLLLLLTYGDSSRDSWAFREENFEREKLLGRWKESLFKIGCWKGQ